METLEEIYLKEYENYIYKDLEPIVSPEMEVVEAPEFMQIDPLSKALAEGVAGVQSDFETNPVEALYGTGKGVVQGAVGLPGDLISLVRGVADVLQTPEGKNKLDAFLAGTEKSTGAPTAMDVKMFLEDTLGLPKSSAEYAEGLGELVAPGRLATKAVSKAAKAVSKNKAKSLATATAASAPEAKREKVNE